eukprot:1475263-Rhodomonas_salina.1
MSFPCSESRRSRFRVDSLCKVKLSGSSIIGYPGTRYNFKLKAATLCKNLGPGDTVERSCQCIVAYVRPQALRSKAEPASLAA